MVLFRDRAAERAAKESAARKVNRMRGVSPKVQRGASLPNVDRSPHPCPKGCGRTVRGGVCPGPDC